MSAGEMITRWPLSARFVALSLALLLLVQGAVWLAVRHAADRALGTVDSELERGERSWHDALADRARTLDAAARALVLDDALRDAIASRHAPTVAAALDDHRRRLGAGTVAVLDASLRLQWSQRGADAATAELAAAAQRRGSAGAWLELVGDRLHQVALVPRAERDKDAGWFVAAAAIDNALVTAFRDAHDVDVALVVERDGVRRVELATVAAAGAAAPPAAPQWTLAGEVYRARAVPLFESPRGRCEALLLRSPSPALAPYRDLQRHLAAVTAAGGLLFALAGVGLARRVTAPLRELTAAAQRLGRGELDEPVVHRDRSDEVGAVAHALDRMREDIAGREADVRRLAYLDPPTGLPNRARLRETLRREIDARAERHDGAGGGVALLWLGLNRFKAVNDRLGHGVGDRVLAAVAERLRGVPLRDGDGVARLGGDEFALMFVDVDRDTALAGAHRLVQGFATPLPVDGQSVDVAASVGLALWPADAGDADELLERAEVAMYAAKRRGVDALAYDPVLDVASAQAQALLGDLRRAVGGGELRLHLQPKVTLGDTGVVGAEALVRWQHPQRGLVPPAEFIAFAEQTGFVREITLWVVDEAARRWETLRVDGAPLRISVNLSARDLLDPQLPAQLDEVLARHRVPAQAFCLEVTESAIVADPARAETALQRLAERGFKLSIDDFGTGLSSLGVLGRLPVGELKVDRSFVGTLDRDARSATVVRSAIHLAHDLGWRVVGEGIENAATWLRLRDWGCDEGQGYHIGRPMPAEELPSWSRQWRQHKARDLRARPSLPA